MRVVPTHSWIGRCIALSGSMEKNHLKHIITKFPIKFPIKSPVSDLFNLGGCRPENPEGGGEPPPPELPVTNTASQQYNMKSEAADEPGTVVQFSRQLTLAENVASLPEDVSMYLCNILGIGVRDIIFVVRRFPVKVVIF